MRSKNVIYSSVSFIEHRLSDELTIDELAKQSFFSRTHYKRLFQTVMGEPVMEYIKKRRLQRAGMALCETDLSVLEVALQFGYSSHEGFSRAFKAHFDMPPLEYRKRYSASKINLYHKEAVNMITSEARKNITKHTDEITKELEIFVTNLEKWTKPAQLEIEKAGRTAGGMRVAFQEWVNLTGRINSAKFEIQKIPAETETVYDLYDKTDKMTKTFDDIIFQMNLLRFLTH
jgi:AraC family transcriptional regulator